MIYLFQKVLEGYLDKTKMNETRKIIMDEIPKALENNIENYTDYEFKGSVGMGVRTHIPWVSINNPLFKESGKEIYIAFLFKEDQSGFFMSLVQDFSSMKIKNKDRTIDVLKQESARLLEMVKPVSPDFHGVLLKLGGNNPKSPNAVFYEASNIISKYYPKHKLPSDELFKLELEEMLQYYDRLLYKVL